MRKAGARLSLVKAASPPPAGGHRPAGTAVLVRSPVTVGGLTVIEVPSREEAHKWAAKWAAVCRCDQEIWELGFDPKIDAMLRRADNRRSRPDDA